MDLGRLAALEGHGLERGFDARALDARSLKKEVTAWAAGQGIPHREWAIFECSGSAAGQSTAFGLLVHGATLSVVGFTLDRIELRLSNLMAFHARALGNWGCAPELYPAALQLVLDGRVKLQPFIERHPLAEINRVLDDVHARRLTRRPILLPSLEA